MEILWGNLFLLMVVISIFQWVSVKIRLEPWQHFSLVILIGICLPPAAHFL